MAKKPKPTTQKNGRASKAKPATKVATSSKEQATDITAQIRQAYLRYVLTRPDRSWLAAIEDIRSRAEVLCKLILALVLDWSAIYRVPDADEIKTLVEKARLLRSCKRLDDVFAGLSADENPDKPASADILVELCQGNTPAALDRCAHLCRRLVAIADRQILTAEAKRREALSLRRGSRGGVPDLALRDLKRWMTKNHVGPLRAARVIAELTPFTRPGDSEQTEEESVEWQRERLAKLWEARLKPRRGGSSLKITARRRSGSTR